MNLSNEVAILETLAKSLEKEMAEAKATIAVLQSENANLKSMIDRSEAERNHYRDRCAELKTLLDHTGSSLVAGIHSMHERAKAINAEEVLRIGNGAA